ncbi:MAG TPA: hypothetical protein VHI93_03340 [Candidatus Thermoplasmatota archaeon]|nr:hypothetical protein [Candidatus Thermoplasmatota archaeon]
MKAELVFLRLDDVGAELDLARVATLLGQPPVHAPVPRRAQAPGHALLPRPLEVQLAPDPAWQAPPGTQVEVRAHAVGCLVVRVRIPLEVADLAELRAVAQGMQLGGQPVQQRMAGLSAQARKELRPAWVEPYQVHVEPETYLVHCVIDSPPPDLKGPDRALVAALITGELPGSMAPENVDSAVKHQLRYYRDDLVVVGWDNALLVGRAGSHEEVLDVLELANLELLELRTYDAVLDAELDGAFAALDRLWAPGGLWRSARRTLRDLSALRVDFARLTDNLHDTGKLFGDWYLAKLHARLRDAFHLPHWERAVATKLASLAEMFQLAEGEANHRRSLTLEWMIVFLFLLDLALIFLLGGLP